MTWTLRERVDNKVVVFFTVMKCITQATEIRSYKSLLYVK